MIRGLESIYIPNLFLGQACFTNLTFSEFLGIVPMTLATLMHGKIYIGQTVHRIGGRFDEHLRNLEINDKD